VKSNQLQVARKGSELYVKHKICHIIMLKVEWVCTGRTNKYSVSNHCYKNPFENWSKVSIINRDLLEPRTRSKSFNLNMCNRIMCFAVHTPKISASKKKMGLRFNLSDTKSNFQNFDTHLAVV